MQAIVTQIVGIVALVHLAYAALFVHGTLKVQARPRKRMEAVPEVVPKNFYDANTSIANTKY